MSSTTIGDHIRVRRVRNKTTRHLYADDDPAMTHVVLPISQPNSFCNSSMSSSNEITRKKKKPQTSSSFRGLGCNSTAAQEVSLPSMIRSSADWDSKSKKKKKKRSNEDGSIRFLSDAKDVDNGGVCVAIPDVWCGSGTGFSTDAVEVDSPVVSAPPRRNLPSSHRKIDQTEMMMLRDGFVMRRIKDSRDHFHNLRLDVDSMSYEQLLELGDRIGYVNTGLKESEIHRCLQRINSHTLADRKCCICQDEYERDGDVGRLECGHSFHVHCVKQWLSRKNACPVCKKTAHIKP